MTRIAATGKNREPVMPPPTRSILITMILAALASGTIACTTETNGLPTPGATPSATGRPTIPGGGGGGGPANPTSPNSPNPDDSPVRNTDPCTLLTPTEASTLGVGPGKREEDTSSGASRACQWVASGQFTIQVGTFDVLGIKEVVATGEIKPVPTVGKHQAVQSVYGTVCAISIEITRTSRVDIGASANGDTAKSCQIAMQLAQMVEPRLPGGS